MKFLKLILLLLFTLSPVISRAYINDDGTVSISLRKKFDKGTGGRPEQPSLQSISCFYDDGLLIIEFNVSEGECEIVIQTNTGETFYSSFDSSELITTVYTGEFEEAEIELSTQKGNVYYGTITVN